MRQFESFKKDIRKQNATLLKLFSKAESEAKKAGHSLLVKLIKKEKSAIIKGYEALEKKATAFVPLLKLGVQKETRQLKKKVEALVKAKDVLVSDNFLLEYKKKDLLQLTQKLEEAYEQISAKNEELLQQQEKIFEQSNTLNSIHSSLLEKNRELEQQKDALLDQSDYLHEANETISSMHEEVQKQKDEILRKNEELLSLNNEKNNLIGIVAHDLKSPLNQIKGFLSLMKMSSPNLDAETMSYITMIEKSAGRLTDLIGKILDVEAIESQTLNLSLENVDLSQTVRTVCDRFSVMAQSKGIHLHTTITEGLCVMADSSYVEQVIENLISNALKFSPLDKNVFVSVMNDGARIIVQVRDEGPGISAEDKRKLFGKYQKLSARPTGNETSTGLGLAIVKKFVDAMNGEIWCESEEGRGAGFFVSFKKN